MDILVDFDGTCVTHDYPRIGQPIGSEPVLKELIANGHRIILFTMRSGKELGEAFDWFKANVGELYGINTNPEQSQWTSSPKAYGQLIIDDIALGVPLKFDDKLSNRFFVDWVKVDMILRQMGLI